MHSRAWWKLCCLGLAAAACADGSTGPDAGPVAPAGGPGAVAMAVAASGEGYHLATDKDDYLPGDTVRVSGDGWPAGDTLDLVLEDMPATREPHRWSVAVGALGSFTDSTYVVGEADLGLTFTLTATSRTTGGTLALVFTDGLPQSLALSPATVAALPGTAAQFVATVGMGGSSAPCTVTMEMLTALPAGITASFGNSPFTATTQPVASTLTLSTSSTTAPGNYTFRVRALRGANCDPAPSSPTVTGLLVVIGPPAKVGFGQHPTTSVSGQPVAPAVTVRVLDAANVVVPNSSAPITVALGANPGGGTLGGTLIRAAVNGVATFDDLTIDRFASGYTLTAGSPGLAGATSVAFTVNRATPARLGFARQPSGGSPGAAWTGQPQVAIQDAGGNTVTSGPGSGAAVTLALESGGVPGAALGCVANPVFAVNGIATFSGCRIDLEGLGYRLRATSGTLTPAMSETLDIEPLNRPPAVSAGGPYAAPEGAELLLAPVVSDPDGDALSYRWTVAAAGMDAGGGCALADATERDARVRCTDDSGDAPAARFTLTLEVTDGRASPVTATAPLSVANAVPALAGLAGPGGGALPASVVVGQSLSLRGTFTDEGEHDTHVAELDCGRGWGAPAAAGSPFDRTCVFEAVGPRTVRVRVTDDDGAAAVRTHALVVTYAVEGFLEPVAAAHARTPWRAGQGIPLKWRVTDFAGRPVLGLAPVSVKSAQTACDGGPGAGLREERAEGESGMKELGDGRYQIVWKPPVAYAGTCRAVRLEFAPGYATAPLGWIEFKPPAR